MTNLNHKILERVRELPTKNRQLNRRRHARTKSLAVK